MVQKKHEIFNEIVNRIVTVSNPEKIILFGSYTCGVPSDDSDIDIIVIKKYIQSRIGEYRTIHKSVMGLAKSFDIIILTTEEFDKYSSTWSNSVFAGALKKGVVLYAI